MSEECDPLPSTTPENGKWLWDWGDRTWFPEGRRDFDVATIECWKYEDEKKEQTILPNQRCQVRGFHTESMNSWLKEPIPIVNGRQPSSGMKFVALPCAEVGSIPHLTEAETHSLNAAFGLPDFQKHYATVDCGGCGMFLQSDGSYVFIVRRTTDLPTITTALRYDPKVNVTQGVFHFKSSIYGFGIFEAVIDHFIQCSHPLLLPLLAVELVHGKNVGDMMTNAEDLYSVEKQTGHGIGSLQAKPKLGSDYRTIVKKLGVLQSQYYLALGTLSWCRISAETIRAKLQHLQTVLPDQRRGELELPCRMLHERVEFLLNSIECAVVFNGIRERMETQQTVLFNLIAQSDNLINVGLAKDSKEMAVASKQDSSAMKIIALLTTFFLPGTFIASFFAMPLFDWSEPTLSRVANRHFWIYWAVTGPLTLTIMAGVIAWAVWNNRRVALLQSRARDSVSTKSTGNKGRDTDEDQESGGEEDEGQDTESEEDEGQDIDTEEDEGQDIDTEEDEGQDTDTEQSPERDAEKMGFRQKYSLRNILNRRKRHVAAVEAEP